MKIFQIGFNKCGSQTLAFFLEKNGIKSIHYDRGRLASSIFANFRDGRPLLDPKYENYIGIFDIENIHGEEPLYLTLEVIKTLDKQYPGSKFILNTRNMNSWIKSRLNHRLNRELYYIDVIRVHYNVETNEEVIAKWEAQWHTHHQQVLDYFKDRPEDLLVFDIENDTAEKLRAFFAEHFTLDCTKYEHRNKTRLEMC